MWRKLFLKTFRVIELVTPSGRRQTMSLDEYRDNYIRENRERARMAYLGMAMRPERHHATEYLFR